MKSGVLEVVLEYPKELCELHSDYPLATDKIGIKRDMLSSNQTKIADFYISIGTIGKLVPLGTIKKLVLLKKSMYFIMKTCNFFKAKIEASNTSCIRIQPITMTKTIC